MNGDKQPTRETKHTQTDRQSDQEHSRDHKYCVSLCRLILASDLG